MDWRSMGIESVSFTCRPELGNGKPFIPLYLGREPLHAGWKVESLAGGDDLPGHWRGRFRLGGSWELGCHMRGRRTRI